MFMQQETVTEAVAVGSPGYVPPAEYQLIVDAQLAAIDAYLRQNAAEPAKD